MHKWLLQLWYGLRYQICYKHTVLYSYHHIDIPYGCAECARDRYTQKQREEVEHEEYRHALCKALQESHNRTSRHT